MKRIYIAAYHQSKFGKLMGMSVPEILRRAVTGTCSEIKVEPSAIDVGSVGAVCNISLNQQGLLAGLVADIPVLAGKPIESVSGKCLRLRQPGRSLRHPETANRMGRHWDCDWL